MDRERLLSQEAEAWDRFVDVVDGLDPLRLEEPAVTPDGWSARDELVHVAAWLEDCARVLGMVAAGTYDAATAEEETPGYVDRVNAEHAVRARTMPAAAARRLLEEARGAAREAFTALGEVDALAWEWFEEAGALHYAKHGHDLASWAAGSSSDPEIGPLLQEETDAWIVFAAALDELPATAPVVAPPGWSAIDVAYHMAAWQEIGAADVEADHGWTLGEGDHVVDELNARFLDEGRALDAGAVRDRLDRARTRLRAALAGAIAPSTEAKEWFRANGVEHYEEHVDALRRSAG
ncbi:MAG: maleylpyruvate isomerase N-terminal domain-containing protein [Actinomycetota bacterium]